MHERNDYALIRIRRIYSWLIIVFTGAFAVFVLSLAVTIGMNLMALFDVSPAEAAERVVPSPEAMEPGPYVPTASLPVAIKPTTVSHEAVTPTVILPTATPEPTATPAEPTPAPPTATPVPTQMPMLEPTETGMPIPIEAVDPTPQPTNVVGGEIPSAIKVDAEVRWIDVDLSEQRLTAYVGKTPVKTYLVSTGLPQTPTPVGQYAIWIKLRYDDMAGADYYIEDVPYVMYFHEGYGLHGVTWHANFGHRMSHGCVNQPNDMAEWLFHFADVGTIVNIHE